MAFVDTLKEAFEGHRELFGGLALSRTDFEKAPIKSLLFQTGFLTVKEVSPTLPASYVLGFPNLEVTQAMAQNYLDALAGDQGADTGGFQYRMAQAGRAGVEAGKDCGDCRGLGPA